MCGGSKGVKVGPQINGSLGFVVPKVTLQGDARTPILGILMQLSSFGLGLWLFFKRLSK